MNRDIWISGLGAICAAGHNLADCMSALRAGTRPQGRPDFLRSLREEFGDLPENPVCAVYGPLPDSLMADNLVPARLIPDGQRDQSEGCQSGQSGQGGQKQNDPLSGPMPGWAQAGASRENWRRGSTRDSARLLLSAAGEALASAGLASLPARVGICVGTTAGCALHFLGDYGQLRRNPEQGGVYPAIDDFYAASMAAELATQLERGGFGGFSGPVLTISNACTSGADAIAMAAGWIRQGQCDVALAGGTDALSVVPYIGFNKLMIYSSGPCKPFDVGRSGLNLGEGAGVLVLESAGHAKKRGAVPLGLLKGWGTAADAYHMTAPHPDGRGLRKAIGLALDMAGAVPSDVEFINVHGTSTLENDKIESLVYGEMFDHARLWASKGVTGHCLGGAGALEAVFTVRALAEARVPASAGCETPEEAVAKMITRRESRLEGGLGLSVSLGFGGSNAALVFGKAD